MKPGQKLTEMGAEQGEVSAKYFNKQNFNKKYFNKKYFKKIFPQQNFTKKYFNKNHFNSFFPPKVFQQQKLQDFATNSDLQDICILLHIRGRTSQRTICSQSSLVRLIDMFIMMMMKMMMMMVMTMISSISGRDIEVELLLVFGLFT